MTKGTMHVNGHYYPSPHPAWGGFCDELFHYTSRYYAVTESFLRHIAELPGFSMAGYKAHKLSHVQRQVMSAIMLERPDKQSALNVIAIVNAVNAGSDSLEQVLIDNFSALGQVEHDDDMVGHVPKTHTLDVAPLDPWLNLAERLNMAVAVHNHIIEIDMKMLAQHLDSPNSTLRSNLQNTIVELHEAGYQIKNHPHLTHHEAIDLGEEGAV